jgi:hypothetical protein
MVTKVTGLGKFSPFGQIIKYASSQIFGIHFSFKKFCIKFDMWLFILYNEQDTILIIEPVALAPHLDKCSTQVCIRQSVI